MGNPKQWYGSGKPIQHLKEVNDGLTGLGNAIDDLKSMLNNPNLTSAQRAAVSRAIDKTKALRNKIQKTLDNARSAAAKAKNDNSAGNRDKTP